MVRGGLGDMFTNKIVKLLECSDAIWHNLLEKFAGGGFDFPLFNN